MFELKGGVVPLSIAKRTSGNGQKVGTVQYKREKAIFDGSDACSRWSFGVLRTHLFLANQRLPWPSNPTRLGKDVLV